VDRSIDGKAPDGCGAQFDRVADWVCMTDQILLSFVEAHVLGV
jgi:hypothetical protein